MTARRSLTLVTAPAAEPVTRTEAKAWAKIDTSDDDTLIDSLLVAARQAAEEYTRRAFITQTWRLTLDLPSTRVPWVPGYFDMPESAMYGDLPGSIELPRQPIQGITNVKTYDTANAESTYASTNYTLVGTRLVLNRDALWPTSLRSAGAAAVTYTCGYGSSAADVPQAVRTAILMHFQAMYDGRVVCDLPAGCQQLLRQYRVMDGLRG